MIQSSVKILLQSLEKKNRILNEMIEQNEAQAEILKEEVLNMDKLDASIECLSAYVTELDKLDQGFETLYEKVRTEMIQDKAKYQIEILQMQQLIQQITDKIVKLNAGRLRNKMQAENQFKRKQQEIKGAVSKTKVARNYYNSMNKLNYVAPQFYDNKK